MVSVYTGSLCPQITKMHPPKLREYSSDKVKKKNLMQFSFQYYEIFILPSPCVYAWPVELALMHSLSNTNVWKAEKKHRNEKWLLQSQKPHSYVYKDPDPHRLHSLSSWQYIDTVKTPWLQC